MRPSQSKPVAETAAVLARWILGGCFLYMGFSKALDPAHFATLIHSYKTFTNPLFINSVAALLPWFEIFCGLLLILGVAVRGTSLIIALMLVFFTGLVLQHGLALASAKNLALCAVKFDCGCGNGEVFVCHKLTENGALIALAVWLTLKRSGKLCARFGLFNRQASGTTETVVAGDPS